jgi:hypothetical protein
MSPNMPNGSSRNKPTLAFARPAMQKTNASKAKKKFCLDAGPLFAPGGNTVTPLLPQ